MSATTTLDDLSGTLERKIENIMECVHNLDGNYDEREIVEVAHHISQITPDELNQLQRLPHPDDYDYDDDDDNDEDW